MIKAVGLEMHWLPRDLGSLFVKGDNMNSISYWFETVKEKYKQ